MTLTNIGGDDFAVAGVGKVGYLRSTSVTCLGEVCSRLAGFVPPSRHDDRFVMAMMRRLAIRVPAVTSFIDTDYKLISC